MMVKITALLFVAIWAAQGAVAQGVLFDCEFPQAKRNKGWISSRVAIVVADKKTLDIPIQQKFGDVRQATRAVQVVDAILIGLDVSPAPTSILRNDDQTLHVTWSTDVEDSRKQKAHLVYNAKLNKRTLKIRLTGLPQGFSTRLSARGSCTAREK